MHHRAYFQLCAVVAASLVTASPITLNPPAEQLFQARASCSEGTNRICYGPDGGTSQNLDLDDVAYVAAYLRFIGQQNEGADARWTMPAASDCAEWALPVDGAGTVLALAKHVNPVITSSVLYEDLASTIDGGPDATEAQQQAALLGCATNGGQMGVKFDASNPAYNTDEYKSTKARPDGIIIKLVRAPDS
ncbi:hypothetical protein AAE478_005668 [Parahypoxylon ruwenzoriense]